MAQPATHVDAARRAGNDAETPRRPSPTVEQARLGIMPAASGSKGLEDVTEWMRTAPHFDGTDEEFEQFERAIAENRAMRRQIAQERHS